MARSLALVVLGGMGAGCGGEARALLDKQAVLERFEWWDNRDFDWYTDKIPFLETPDAELDATYYYRWEVLTKHLVYGSPEHGYTFTEFIDRPYWSGTYGAISCPLGHQFYEVRWLKDLRIVEDFARYWFEVPGAQPRSYSNWYGDSMWAVYQVLGDRDFIVAMLPYMEAQYAGWMRERWDPEHGMFRWDGMHDGMETNIDSRQTPAWFDGAEGYRPTLNSYLYADAMAIAKAASVAGEEGKAAQYRERARALKDRVQAELWDPEREFFFHQFAAAETTVDEPWPGSSGDRADSAGVGEARVPATSPGAPIAAKTLTYESGPWAGSPYGREAIGFVPWQFGLPDAGYETAWKTLMDPERFYAPFGPTTTEQGDPLYYVSPRCCVWSGNAWPYATTQTLEALANLLNDYEQEYVDADDFVQLLSIYSRTQRKDGRPYVAEAADPDTGSWSGHDTFFHSEHYLHSGIIDLMITGLIGLRPADDDRLVVNPLVPDDWDWFALDDVAYRGHRVSVIWDRDGSRYGRGAGLSVLLHDEVIATRSQIGRLEVELPATTPRAPAESKINWAVNNQPAWYPAANASSSRPENPPSWAIDGQYWYHRSPPNRWVAEESDVEAWFEVDFGRPRAIDSVKLYFLDDTITVADFVAEDAPERFAAAKRSSTAVPAPPSAYRLLGYEPQGWVEIPEQRRQPATPSGRRANVVSFPSLEITRLRVVFEPEPGTVAGLSEIEAWGTGPKLPPERPPDSLAFNSGEDEFPRASASFVAVGTSPALLNDGESAFNYYSRKRWSATGSENAEDWVAIEFGSSRQISSIELHLWAWESRGTAAPRGYTVEWLDGERWESVRELSRAPAQPLAMAVNRVEFEPVVTTAVRVRFEHALPDSTAVSEVVVR